jgi:PPOX class probable F420-dependent enzyme
MNLIPESHQDLLKDDVRAFVYLATVMADGSHQVTPVWFSADEKYILINTAQGRIKDRNMRARPAVALCIADPDKPYRYLQIRGKVVENTTDGADDHIDRLAFKYTGNPKYQNRMPGQTRVIFKIVPEKVDAHG